ncbi:MAG: prepilin-type N-terminal cleavage/methylation domain-containing protein [Phycisphaerales bacterium]|nr:MAG: prepilin-type N-terminal cleavage/methylation domain-containing protein [Phycisphaerales bacterium]
MSKSEGFALIELLVAIAIIALVSDGYEAADRRESPAFSAVQRILGPGPILKRGL